MSQTGPRSAGEDPAQRSATQTKEGDFSRLRDLPLPLREQLEALGLNRTLSQLIESERRFRDLFEQGPVAYHELDQEGIVRWVNQAECDLLGVEAGAMLGKPIFDFVSRGVPSESRDAFQRKLTGRQALVSFPRDHVCSDGRHPTLDIHEAPIRDDGYSSHLSTARQLLRRKAGGSEPVYGRRAGYQEFPAGFGHASAARVRMNDIRNSQPAHGDSRGRPARPSGAREELAPERGENEV